MKLLIEKTGFTENIKGVAPEQKTAFELSLNGGVLCARFDVCAKSKCADKTRYNSKLYEGDVVELFIGSRFNEKRYLEFEVNPLNARFCAKIHNSGKGKIKITKCKTPLFTSDVTDTDFGYSVTLFISEKTLLNKLALSEISDLRLNAFRIDYSAGVTLSALNPTLKPRFHFPKNLFL